MQDRISTLQRNEVCLKRPAAPKTGQGEGKGSERGRKSSSPEASSQPPSQSPGMRCPF